MTDFGVNPQGFALKRLPDILADIEAGMRAAFGEGVIQTAVSPLGKLNGLMADLASAEWELALAVYQSYDPDQAEGARLDTLAKLRLLARAPGELDADFRPDITNVGRARIDIADLSRAVRAITGVSYAQVFLNDGAAADANGVASHSVCLAALGGVNADIGQALRTYVVPGVGTSGNTRIDVALDGFCRTLYLMRPTEIPVTMAVQAYLRPDRNGCPPPATAAVVAAIAAGLTGSGRPLNGDDLTIQLIRSAVAISLPTVEIASVTAARNSDVLAAAPLVIAFDEIMAVDVSRITVAAL